MKRGIVDWIVCGVLGGFTLFGMGWWLSQPTKENQGDCYRRVTREIQNQKLNAGETTIKDQQEIEAIASEVKSKCR